MRTFAVALGMLAVLGAAACGGSSGPPAGSIKVTMNDFSFTPKDLTAKAGSSTFYLVNEGKSAHDFTVEDSSGKILGQSELVQPGNTALLTVKLDAATYKVLCTQPGHADAGMVASLAVS
jgi:uncharacterized cupredoxin-like copper-binding protein